MRRDHGNHRSSLGSGESRRTTLVSVSVLTLVFLALACLSLGTGAAHAEIYKYVDRNGVTHYSDSVSSVPRKYRDQVRDITDELDDMTGFRVVRGANGGSRAGSNEPGAKPSIVLADLSSFGSDFDAQEAAQKLLESLGFGIILIVVLAVPILYCISAVILRLACRLAGAEAPTFGRACGVLFVQTIAGMALGAASAGIGVSLGVGESASIGSSIALSAASSAASWMVNAGLLSSLTGIAFMRSLWVGILHTILTLVLVGAPVAALVAIFLFLG